MNNSTEIVDAITTSSAKNRENVNTPAKLAEVTTSVVVWEDASSTFGSPAKNACLIPIVAANTTESTNAIEAPLL